MATQTTQPSPSDEITKRLVAIESRLKAVEKTSKRLYLFGAGLALMVAGLTTVLSQLEAIPVWNAITYWGVVVFVIGLLPCVFIRCIVK
jgi:predicted membrane channel-forming protein YqfA (hemolysin III family)